jgi:hypothetical protein
VRDILNGTAFNLGDLNWYGKGLVRANEAVADAMSIFDPSRPLPPTHLTATAGDAYVSLTWEASAGATSFNVYRSTDSLTYDQIASDLTAGSHRSVHRYQHRFRWHHHELELVTTPGTRAPIRHPSPPS